MVVKTECSLIEMTSWHLTKLKVDEMTFQKHFIIPGLQNKSIAGLGST